MSNTPRPVVLKAEAYVDTMPIQPTIGGTLHVTLEYNGNGESGSLEKAVPQGIVKNQLILNLVYSDEQIFIINPQTNTYEEQLHESSQYHSILINFEGTELTTITKIPIRK